MHILREPLAQFLFLGALLYGGYFLFIGPDEPIEEQKRFIYIDENRINWLKALWERKFKRPPTSEELQQQIARYEKETVYYREALALGLDREDSIIKRHLADKLRFLREDVVTPDKPSRQALLEYYQANRDRYTSSSRYSLKHLYFSLASGQEKAFDNAKQALVRLQQDPEAVADIRTDPLSLKHRYEDQGVKSLSRIFGSRFANALADRPVAEWFGPVASGYGIHLVYIDSHTKPALMEFEQVIDRVERAWIDQRQKALNEAYYQSLRQKYEFVIEKPVRDTNDKA